MDQHKAGQGLGLHFVGIVDYCFGDGKIMSVLWITVLVTVKLCRDRGFMFCRWSNDVRIGDNCFGDGQMM